MNIIYPRKAKTQGYLREIIVEDVMIASIDGSKGFPEAIRAVFPKVLEG